MERKYFRNLTDDERKQLKENIFQQLKIKESGKAVRKLPVGKLIAIGMAASLLIAVGLLILRTDNQPGTGKILIARTGDGETRQIMLADSSVVVLNAGSELYTNAAYTSATREVFLTGNGFFKVRKLASRRKFVVHARDLQVTVLGTQFNVNARNDEVSVALTSGKVQVTTGNDQKNSAYMVPGDKVHLNAGKSTFVKEQIDTTMYSAWTKGEWNFKNSSLAEIAQLIKEYYNVEVIFANTKQMNQQMTAVIPVNTLEGLVKVISATLAVNISQKNKQLIIQ
jgi:ferric-dicitrate binding protein FerR (iron transport regulator)